MKILGVDVVGLKSAVGQNNSGKFTGVILIDLSDLAIVTFNPTGPDFTYYREPGVVELHRTSNLRFNKASMNDIKAQIAAHILTLREVDLEPDEYSFELSWAGKGLGKGDELLQIFNKHFTSLTSGVM